MTLDKSNNITHTIKVEFALNMKLYSKHIAKIGIKS